MQESVIYLERESSNGRTDRKEKFSYGPVLISNNEQAVQSTCSSQRPALLISSLFHVVCAEYLTVMGLMGCQIL
jgi:phage-related protein